MNIARILTIGHSNHSTEFFQELLARHCVTAVADVRSSPFSRFSPQFNREQISETLGTSGISYVFLGRELGGRSEDRSCYERGRVCYDLLARTNSFHRGLDRVQRGARRFRIALMCTEKDPIDCHRAILVCRHLADRGIDICHILSDGALESHEELIDRLLHELDLSEPDLIHGSREDRIAEAYSRRGRQIAYTEHNSAERHTRQGELL